jgi:hypothetical protein
MGGVQALGWGSSWADAVPSEVGVYGYVLFIFLIYLSFRPPSCLYIRAQQVQHFPSNPKQIPNADPKHQICIPAPSTKCVCQLYVQETNRGGWADQ